MIHCKHLRKNSTGGRPLTAPPPLPTYNPGGAGSDPSGVGDSNGDDKSLTSAIPVMVLPSPTVSWHEFDGMIVFMALFSAGRDFCQYSNSGDVTLASLVLLVYGLAVG